MNIYLDYAATTPILPDVKEYVINIFDSFGNPSSNHSIGQKSKGIIDSSRRTVSEFINGISKNVYFTSSGSASNTLAIKGYCSIHNAQIIYSPLLHKSAIKCIETYKNRSALKVDIDGLIDIDDLKNKLSCCASTPFVVVDYANSEIGTIQNVEEIISLTKSFGGVVYLDCTGSISTISLDVKNLQVDMCGFSGHKIGALKGCGVLYKKDNIKLEPIIYGSQENGLFGGTENILGVASLKKAIEYFDYSKVNSSCRDYVYNTLINFVPDCYLVGSLNNRLPHNLYMCFRRVSGESLMMLLDTYGIQVSTGSACNSGNMYPSHTLSAIGIDKNDIDCCIRMSFSGSESKDELNFVCDTIGKCVGELRSFMPN